MMKNRIARCPKTTSCSVEIPDFINLLFGDLSQLESCNGMQSMTRKDIFITTVLI